MNVQLSNAWEPHWLDMKLINTGFCLEAEAVCDNGFERVA